MLSLFALTDRILDFLFCSDTSIVPIRYKRGKESRTFYSRKLINSLLCIPLKSPRFRPTRAFLSDLLFRLESELVGFHVDTPLDYYVYYVGDVYESIWFVHASLHLSSLLLTNLSM